MPVNVSQYRGVVVVFNSRYIHIKQYNIFKNTFSQSKVNKSIAKEIFIVFASFLMFLLVSCNWSFINLPRIITCDARNPPWIDEKIEKLVLQKKGAFLAYSRGKNNTDLFNKFQFLQAHLKTTIE